ncbi:efflux RND transporter periplasmic adaptor subunit [Myroides sp. DF42-4-2]|uniref:efflux RND transporter periplasmic adaptor subunit n=2 Tax=Myroides TaxID=76831 RepID=UPI0025750201|nr:efflux RND transporter periplasmic adaptor subunit [Myroides sp. DF42-4-2]
MHVLSKFMWMLCLLSLVSSCKKNTEQGGWGTMPNEGSFPLQTIQKEKAIVYTSYPATIRGIRDIEIRPKIEGYIESIFVDEGQWVTKGQALFTLYAPQYAEENQAAQAKLNEAEAAVSQAQLQVEKTKPLVEEGIISPFELKTATLDLKSKQAFLAQVQAERNISKSNAAYTTITAPFDGYVGLLPYKQGALVNTQTQLPLTVLSDISTISAYFSMSEKQYLALAQQAHNQALLPYVQAMATVELQLSDQQLFDQQGSITAISGQLDLQTGSIQVRAAFPNPHQLVRSGSTGVIRLKYEMEQALVIPQLATFDIQGKRFVYIVNTENVIESREIKLLEHQPSSDSFIVVDGIKEGDVIIADQIGGAKEGMKVVN